MRSHRRAVLALLALLTGGVVLDATVVVPMDLRELVVQASLIVYGRVTDVRGLAVDRRAESVVTLGTPFFLKGSGGREVQFRLPGGRIGRYRTVVPGTPELQRGDEVVVFLTDDAPVGVLLGFSQGVLKVSRASTGAPPMLLAPPVSRDARAERVTRGGDAVRFLTLSTFVERVRALMAVAPESPPPGPRRAAGAGKTGSW